jgi:hypothetical protein
MSRQYEVELTSQAPIILGSCKLQILSQSFNLSISDVASVQEAEKILSSESANLPPRSFYPFWIPTRIVSIGTNLISTFLKILLISRCAKLSSVTDGSSAIASMAAIFSDVVMFASSMCIISSFPDIDAVGVLIWMSVFILRAEWRCSGYDSDFARVSNWG